MQIKKAIEKIEKRGVLLVYPINNAKEPASLWSELYPRSEMRWEWDSGGDNRVAGLWHLREELSHSGKVVYAKWFRGRATFFSRKLFPAFLQRLGNVNALSSDAREVLRQLTQESPLSTKALKKRVKLEGRVNEKQYDKALKELWGQLLIVGYGEVDDGAFPSLAIGATEILFEDLYQEGQTMKSEESTKRLATLSEDSLFLKWLKKEESLKEKSATQPLRKKGGRLVLRGSDLSLHLKD